MIITPSALKEDIPKNGQIKPPLKLGNKRSIIPSIIALAKHNLLELLEKIIQNRIFKVKVENSISYVQQLKELEKILLQLSKNLLAIKVEVPPTNLTLNVPADDKLTELTEEVRNATTISLEDSQKLQEVLDQVGQQLGILGSSVAKIKLTLPEIQKVSGQVDIGKMPKIYDFDKITSLLEELKYTISSLKIEVPKQQPIKIPEFPKSLSFLESKLILNSLRELKESIDKLPKRFPEIDFPRVVSVDNFPPQKYPNPVTHVSINALGGEATATSINVSTTRTPLPGNAEQSLANRRSILIFNNDASITVFIGGANVVAGDGLPVLAQSYSPVIDAGSNMVIYGITSSGTANVRVLELSDIAVGR